MLSKTVCCETSKAETHIFLMLTYYYPARTKGAETRQTRPTAQQICGRFVPLFFGGGGGGRGELGMSKQLHTPDIFPHEFR